MFRFRGRTVALSGFAPRTTLLDWLRLEAGATGVKEGCNEGDCGACTIVLARLRDGRLVHEAVNACILLLGQIDGCEVLTVEDLADGAHLHPVQQALVDFHGSQCGFCTPGIVMSLFALHQDGPHPATYAEICDRLAGNLCRCTGYKPIIEAALASCAEPAADRFTAAQDARAAALAAINDARDLFVGDPSGFFAAPASVDALAALLLAHPDALIVSGATDVGLWITKALQDPRKIVWLGRVAGFDDVRTENGALRIGAGASLAKARAALGAHADDLGEIVRRFASTQIRNSATVGGNIANGSPIGDLAPCLIALGATLVLRRGDETRRMPLEDFFVAFRKQDRRASEFVAAIELPARAAHTQFRAFKVSKRPDEDISAVLGAFGLTIENGCITDARVAFGGMAATPARAMKTERALVGAALADPASWRPAIDALSQDYTPIDDMRASAAYRRMVAANLLRKALMELAGSAAPLRVATLAPVETAGADV